MLEISNDLTGLIFFFCLRSFEESGLSTKIKTKTKGVCVVATEICLHFKL